MIFLCRINSWAALVSESEVGVILPTYGEADNIGRLIDDIENLKLKRQNS